MLLVAKKEKRGPKAPSGFGPRLRAIREGKGLTQASLGTLVGMAYQAVARLERGEVEPTWPTIIKLADALGVDVGEFRGG